MDVLLRAVVHQHGLLQEWVRLCQRRLQRRCCQDQSAVQYLDLVDSAAKKDQHGPKWHRIGRSSRDLVADRRELLKVRDSKVADTDLNEMLDVSNEPPQVQHQAQTYRLDFAAFVHLDHLEPSRGDTGRIDVDGTLIPLRIRPRASRTHGLARKERDGP